ncbi:unnamed protein product [Closterium sp. NIES-53]
MDANGVIQWLEECVEPFLKPGPLAAPSAAPLGPYRDPLTAPVATRHLRSRAAEQHSRQAAEPPDNRSPEPPSSRDAPAPRAARAARAAQQPSRQCRPSRPSRPEPPQQPEPPEPPEPPRAAPAARAARAARAAELPYSGTASTPTGVPRPSLLGLCDRADGLSLFDLTSGVSPAPPATADSTVCSQWATRDAAARLAVRRHLPTTERAHFSQYRSAQTLYDAVVARYSSPATAALSRLFLPYLFPDLAAFPTVADLITHLRTSDTRYRAALPTEFCAKNPPPSLSHSLLRSHSPP